MLIFRWLRVSEVVNVIRRGTIPTTKRTRAVFESMLTGRLAVQPMGTLATQTAHGSARSNECAVAFHTLSERTFFFMGTHVSRQREVWPTRAWPN